jgi:ketosteroid isomerase-like protein
LYLIARRRQQRPRSVPPRAVFGQANHRVPVMTDHVPGGQPESVPIRTVKENGMTLDSEQIVRQAYKIAENKDLEGWVAAFTDDGTFTDQSIGVTYRGPDELPVQVENYARAFPDMHRELYQLYVSGNIVVVQLALQGTHLGPLHLPAGTLPPTGKRMDAPCCDVFELIDGKIKRFDCYPEGSVILTQLGAIGNLSAALEH